jgi:hypothetical protein
MTLFLELGVLGALFTLIPVAGIVIMGLLGLWD